MRLRVALFGVAVLMSGSSTFAIPAPPARHRNSAAPPGHPSVRPNAGQLVSLYAFKGQPDGSSPQGGVVIDAAGNIFGTTQSGGSTNDGSVYELQPSGSTYTEQVILSYSVSDGDQPVATPAMDSADDIFSIAPTGGKSDWGTVVKLQPTGKGKYRKAAFHAFDVTDGATPEGIIRAGSVFYATTYFGGASNAGTIVSIKGAHLKPTVLYSFGKNGSGFFPDWRLAPGSRGTYFGTTASAPASGSGTVFKFTPSQTPPVSTLFTFATASQGQIPNGVVPAKNGDLFGTTQQGGSTGLGVLYKLSAGKSGYTEQILHTFTGANGDGEYPRGTLVLVGNTLYGTTTGGGSMASGTIFQVQTSGNGYAVMYSFKNSSDGASPLGDLLLSNGALYGVSAAGGPGGGGVAWKFIP